MDLNKKRELELTAAKIRKTALETIRNAHSGHIGGSFSMADILAVLYFDKLNIDVKNPKWIDRDRFVLSKGHCTPTTYSALAMRGFFPMEDLKGFRTMTSALSGHMEIHVPGVDMSAGSLGQGLSAAVGMAMANRLDRNPGRIYALTGDGEIQEGIVWEAVMSAAHYRLDNLTVTVDWNGIQIDGRNDEIMTVAPIAEKFSAFGWHTISINGHSMEELDKAFREARNTEGRPTAIIARTIKGKGVSFMEDTNKWHGKAPDDQQTKQAVEELGGVL